MRRWLRLSIAAIAVAAMFAACGGEEEGEAPTATPVATKTPQATATPAATKTATATARPSTPTPTVIAATPTPRPPAPTPQPPTQQVRQPIWTVSQISGAAAQVEVVLEDGLGNAYTVASVDPEVVRWEKWDVEFVADLNGDGIVEVVVLHYTGGAHCCFEYWILSEGPTGIQLDDAFLLNNATIGALTDLDGDGVLEIETADDRLAYFPDLSFADSPFLPLVLCRSADGTYNDCTTQFPEKLRESADEFEGYLRDAVQRQGEDYEKRSPALGLLACYMRLDRDDEGWTKVRSLCPECEDWLMQNYDELENRLILVQPQPVAQ